MSATCARVKPTTLASPSPLCSHCDSHPSGYLRDAIGGGLERVVGEMGVAGGHVHVGVA